MPTRLKPLELVLAGVDRVTGPVRQINRRIESITGPVNRVRRSFRALARDSGLARIGAAARRVGRDIGALARRTALLGTAAVVGGAAALRSFISTADQVAKTADAIGIGIESLQEWRFAADRMGVSNEVLDKGLLRFGRTLGEVRLGTGTLFTILKKNSPELLRQFQAVDNVDEGLELLNKTMARAENQNLRLALANAALGRSGVLLSKLLTLPEDEINELRERAQRLGFVLSEETARAAEDAQDKLTDLGGVTRGIAFSIGSELVPVVRDVVGRILEWHEANRGLVGQRVREYARVLASSVRTVAFWTAETVPKVVALVEAIGGLRGIAAILATVIAGKLVTSILSLSLAIGLTPAGWLLGLLAALVAIIPILILNWERVTAVLRGVWRVMADSPIGVVLLGPLGLLVKAADLLKRHWEPIGALFESIWKRIQPVIGAARSLPSGIARFLSFDAGSLEVGEVRGTRSIAQGVSGAQVLGRQEVGGKIGLEISSPLPVRVTELRSDPNTELDVDTGLAMATP